MVCFIIFDENSLSVLLRKPRLAPPSHDRVAQAVTPAMPEPLVPLLGQPCPRPPRRPRGHVLCQHQRDMRRRARAVLQLVSFRVKPQERPALPPRRRVALRAPVFDPKRHETGQTGRGIRSPHIVDPLAPRRPRVPRRPSQRRRARQIKMPLHPLQRERHRRCDLAFV